MTSKEIGTIKAKYTVCLPKHSLLTQLSCLASRPCPTFSSITTHPSSSSTFTLHDSSTLHSTLLSTHHPILFQILTPAPPSATYTRPYPPTPNSILPTLYSIPLMPPPSSSSSSSRATFLSDTYTFTSMTSFPPLLFSSLLFSSLLFSSLSLSLPLLQPSNQPRPYPYHLPFHPPRSSPLFLALTISQTLTYPPSPRHLLYLLFLAPTHTLRTLPHPPLTLLDSSPTPHSLSQTLTPPPHTPSPSVHILVLALTVDHALTLFSDPSPPARPPPKSWTKVPCSCETWHHPQLVRGR
ncbi:hypothetical protein Pmani_035705 [Petrolisthes manimaculis]|uniref:Uncharacterized protein n=1 Tax=Petrolisthes manimaculis TaxID=1843537 RepID=A0AAE1TQ86_9EUCA|nr:hypothetical protein Pmani_035705 [Petrolisthes manimaculis]